MGQEYEVVSSTQFQYLNVFLVHIFSRTPHLHRELEIGVVLDGQLTLSMGRNVFCLGKDEMYLINSMGVHEFVTEEQGALVLAIQVSSKLVRPFVPDAERIRFETHASLAEMLSADDYRVLLGLRKELALHYHKQDDCFELHCFELIASILFRLWKGLPAEVISRQDWLPLKRRADRMLAVTDYIDQNYQRKLLLEEIAQREGLTMPHLSHLFRETLGMSFQEYLRKRRFEHAFPLVSGTSRPILDISIESGFSDERYLIKAFQKELGCTPREYRIQLQKHRRSHRTTAGSQQYFLPREEVVRWLEQGGAGEAG